MTTKEEILQHLYEITGDISKNQIDRFSTTKIAFDLSLSRSLASSILNELVNEGKLVKINTRPVYYFSVSRLKKVFGNDLEIRPFQNLDEFYACLNSFKYEFATLVGYNNTLSEIIDSIKTALDYPNGGIPILIKGNSGTGKSAMLAAIAKYLSLSREQVLKCDILDENFPQKIERFEIEDANKKSLVVFESINKIDRFNEKKLIQIIQRSRISKAKKYFAFITRDSNYSSEITGMIPIQIRMPDFHEYSFDERKQAVARFIQNEEERIKRKIVISNNTLLQLTSNIFVNNFDGLFNELSCMCANSFKRSESGEEIKLEPIDFSAEQLKSYDFKELSEKEEYFDYGELNSFYKYEWIDIYLKEIEDLEIKYRSQSINSYDLLEKLTSISENCYNEFVYNNRKIYDRSTIYSEIIENITIQIERKYQSSISSVAKIMLSCFIYIQSHDRVRINRQSSVDNICLALKKKYPLVYAVCNDINELIGMSLGIKLNSLFIMLVITNLIAYNEQLNNNYNVSALILCHGYSTASSMAAAVNKLLNKNIFDALDMPLESTYDQIIEQLKIRIEKEHFIKQFLFLVDMGSLERIDEGLRNISNITMGIINGVSTGLALEVGTKIKGGASVSEIIKYVPSKELIEPKLIINDSKIDSIIFLGESDIKIAEHLRNLFVTSLPKQIPLKTLVLASDEQIQKKIETLQSEYNIKHLVGAFDFTVKNINFVDITDLLELRSDMKIYHTLEKYLDNNEMTILRENLVRNYSLQNVVDNLTILNPNILLNEIDEFLKNVEKEFNVKLNTRRKFGLFVHLSIMIERLVMRNDITSYKNMDSFAKKNQHFIQVIEKSFSKIEEHYKIKISLAEICYVYDFFEENEEENK